ncbi:pyridoxal-phosphate dependent enzyme [Priestia aryabhattai]|uniref:pyridoxal-phosphate dependent enzyme n=1 Tax=Priestia TaxID=2800373 RepID=UPI0039830E2F
MIEAAFEEYISPQIYKVKHNLFLVQFKVMKTLPAYKIIKNGLERKEINNDTLIIDTSSGTFALGLALVCHHFGLKLQIITDPAMDKRLKARIEDLGANIIVVEEPDDKGNFQQKRLKVVKDIINLNPNTFWCNQYDNNQNMNAYEDLANLIAKEIGTEIFLVGSVGSGGSTSGTIKYLRNMNPYIKMIAVDTFGSVLFGLPDGKRQLRGLGNSILPKNLKHNLYDEVHWISARLAYKWTRDFHRQFGIFSGGTTGASFGIANYLSSLEPHKTFVFIGPDDGTRYMDTIYNDEWLKQNNLEVPPQFNVLPVEIKVSDIPSCNDLDWAFTNWNRKEVEIG